MNKTILIIGEGEPDNYEAETTIFGDDNRVIVKDIDPNNGDKLRGYNADLIVLTMPIADSVRNRVLSPMTALGGEIIELY